MKSIKYEMQKPSVTGIDHQRVHCSFSLDIDVGTFHGGHDVEKRLDPIFAALDALVAELHQEAAR